MSSSAEFGLPWIAKPRSSGAHDQWSCSDYPTPRQQRRTTHAGLFQCLRITASLGHTADDSLRPTSAPVAANHSDAFETNQSATFANSTIMSNTT